MKPDLNDLMIFTQVVDLGSFTAAADALAVPKSTVSRRVSRLESEFGVRLLQRTTRKLSLTDAGQSLYDRGVRIRSDFEAAQQLVAELHEEPRGRLRVTAPVEFPAFPRLVTDFLTRWPKVQMDLDLTNRRVDVVKQGFDLAVRAGELADSSLIANKLGDRRRILVASPTYLADRGAPQTIDDLQTHDCIVFGPWWSGASWALTGPNGIVKVPITGRLAVNHLDAVRHAALEGYGIALLPTDWVDGDLAAERLGTVLPEASPPKTAIWAVYPSRKHVPPAVRVFVDFLKERFADTRTSLVVNRDHFVPDGP